MKTNHPTACSKASNHTAAADIRRRIPREIIKVRPPRHLGGYVLNVLRTLLLALMLAGAASRGAAQPVITQQPQNQTNVAGTTAIFSVVATGTPSLSYQWRSHANPTTFTNIPGAIEATLTLTNVQPTPRRFGVVVTDGGGLSVTSSPLASLVVLTPPLIIAPPSDQVLYPSGSASFSVVASGTAPLRYQWMFNSPTNLVPGGTNATLSISLVQTNQTGLYFVAITNAYGAVTSTPTLLDLYPAQIRFEARTFTNELGQLPYRLFVPTDYSVSNRYPLILFLHGGGFAGTDNVSQLFDSGEGAFRFVSSENQRRHPAFLVAPQHPTEAFWAQTQMAELIYALLRGLEAELPLDTNRLYVTGASDGGDASWDLRYRSPHRFAAIIPMGSSYSPAYSPFQATSPVWHFQAEDDSLTDVAELHSLVGNIRAAGGHPILTAYARGGHGGQVWRPANNTPPLVDWLMSQRLGVPDAHGPQLRILNPASRSFVTSQSFVNLSGTAVAYDQLVTRVTWTNLQNHLGGVATGRNPWSARVPLQSGAANVIVVIGETTSWSAPLGGVTTFSDTLQVEAVPPLTVGIHKEGPNVGLDWAGGTPPYSIQQATALAPANWTDWRASNDRSLTFVRSEAAAYYRVSSPYSSLSVDDVTFSEGGGDPTNAVFTVRLSAPTDNVVSVDYHTEDGTAVANADYLPIGGTLTFSPGQTQRTISVPVISDTNRELPELFLLRLTNAVNALAPYRAAQCVVLDDDPMPTLAIENVIVMEGDFGTNYAVFTITMSAPKGYQATVLYNTFNQTATAGTDYGAVSGMHTFLPGVSALTIRVPIFGDLAHEIDETFGVLLSDPRAVALPTVSRQGIGTIRNDD